MGRSPREKAMAAKAPAPAVPQPNTSRSPRVVRHPGDAASCRRLAAALRADGYQVVVADDEPALEALLRGGASEADLIVAQAQPSPAQRPSLIESLVSWSFPAASDDDSLVPV